MSPHFSCLRGVNLSTEPENFFRTALPQLLLFLDIPQQVMQGDAYKRWLFFSLFHFFSVFVTRSGNSSETCGLVYPFSFHHFSYIGATSVVSRLFFFGIFTFGDPLTNPFATLFFFSNPFFFKRRPKQPNFSNHFYLQCKGSVHPQSGPLLFPPV